MKRTLFFFYYLFFVLLVVPLNLLYGWCIFIQENLCFTAEIHLSYSLSRAPDAALIALSHRSV